MRCSQRCSSRSTGRTSGYGGSAPAAAAACPQRRAPLGWRRSHTRQSSRGAPSSGLTPSPAAVQCVRITLSEPSSPPCGACASLCQNRHRPRLRHTILGLWSTAGLDSKIRTHVHVL
eukprot:350422-Chlamydomonas_euryale.AAC.5